MTTFSLNTHTINHIMAKSAHLNLLTHDLVVIPYQTQHLQNISQESNKSIAVAALISNDEDSKTRREEKW